jgi:hypothetical protein
MAIPEARKGGILRDGAASNSTLNKEIRYFLRVLSFGKYSAC